jgi:hypothetical protein
MTKMDNSLEDVLNLQNAYEVQFSVLDPTSFAFAIHSVSLY